MSDERNRRRARDEDASFLVRAPAGSGKTTLLTQRFLRLLATVDEPESLLALTFTRKAAGEMRRRILDELAQSPESWAAAARARDVERGWALAANPMRLRVLTLDAFAMHLVGRMPWLTRLGGMPRPTEAAERYYRAAARAVVASMEDERGAPARSLVAHLHGEVDAAVRLICDLLERRDQWLPLLAGADAAALCSAIEAELVAEVPRELARLRHEIPAFAPPHDSLDDWLAVTNQFLTPGGDIKQKKGEFVTTQPVADHLNFARLLAKVTLDDPARDLIAALVVLLPRAVAELQRQFAAAGDCDFTEISLAAARALADPAADGAPTELAFRLDARLRHLFVDECQDTSRAQHRLLAALTADWTSGDGRTLFLVGDPMQSIYGFRNAQVDQFLAAERDGRLGAVALEPLELSRNFRSLPSLVTWCNQTFARISPQQDDLATAAVRFVPAEQEPDDNKTSVTVHALPSRARAAEAAQVAQVAAAALAVEGNVAILVRSRTGLDGIALELTRHGVPFRGIKLRTLNQVPAVVDLLHLTRALLHPADRIAWLAVLRAPCVGLTLADLNALCGDESDYGPTVPDRLRDPVRHAILSPDGQARLATAAPTLLAAAAQARRVPAREIVAWCWRTLGACTTLAPGDETDTAAFFDLIEASDRRGELASGCHDLADAVGRARSAMEGDANARVLLLTAHEAKGLEFDTVLLPGLDRAPRSEPSPLLRWIEYPAADGGDRMLLATQPMRGGESPLYTWLGHKLEQRHRQEQLRLLYVSATRARYALHLFACTPTNRKGELSAPSVRAPLSLLWPVLENDFASHFATDTPPPPPSPTPSQPLPSFRRVPTDWRPPAPPPEVAWRGLDLGAPPSATATPHSAGSSRRRLGIAIHAALQQLTALDPEARLPFLARLNPEVADPLRRMLDDPKAAWILAPHPHAHNEWELTGVIAGSLRHATLDRSFVDDGVRWIIDYKTASHQGSDLDAFLDAQVESYRPQLQSYVQLVSALDPLPIRAGLYFPLLLAWREVSLPPLDIAIRLV